jgi:Tol biopolymer transport system component
VSFDGDTDVYTMRTDGGGRRHVTNNARGDYSPVYSPKGGHIAYVEDIDRTDARDYEIVRIRPGGTDTRSPTTRP